MCRYLAYHLYHTKVSRYLAYPLHHCTTNCQQWRNTVGGLNPHVNSLDKSSMTQHTGRCKMQCGPTVVGGK